ncbi:cation-transporting P-type ATPase [Sphingomonas sp. MS122]|uniref:cation-transporting P-type ATPase n=1 Tax=Sphingomonas sp. MS122 TaxID=3412683 RepID=UPI003C2B400F
MRDGPNEPAAARRRGPWRLILEVLREPMLLLLLIGGTIYLTAAPRAFVPCLGEHRPVPLCGCARGVNQPARRGRRSQTTPPAGPRIDRRPAGQRRARRSTSLAA